METKVRVLSFPFLPFTYPCFLPFFIYFFHSLPPFSPPFPSFRASCQHSFPPSFLCYILVTRIPSILLSFQTILIPFLPSHLLSFLYSSPPSLLPSFFPHPTFLRFFFHATLVSFFPTHLPSLLSRFLPSIQPSFILSLFPFIHPHFLPTSLLPHSIFPPFLLYRDSQ